MENPPEKIDVRFLIHFPGFVEFKTRKRTKRKRDEVKELERYEDETPEELIAEGYKELREKLVVETFG